MRRARIKVMATVPARRKPTRDNNEESIDATKIDLIDADSHKQADIGSVSCSESSQPIVAQSPEVTTMANDEIQLKLVEPKNEPSQTVDTTEQNSVQVFAKSNETSQVTVKENSSPEKEIVIVDSAETCGPDNTRTGSTNVDTRLATKTPQTRTSFMRPTPRLDGGGRIRRNSVQGSGASASESEDDSRRGTTRILNNVKNDTVASAHCPKGRSLINSTAAAHANSADTTIVDVNSVTRSHVTSHSLDSSARQKRKMVISESARKLAESRREFLLRHEHKQPDKTKLIMYDLIYYNPVTNPMKKSDGSSGPSTNQRISSSSANTTAQMEDEDDDDRDDDVDNVDEEEATDAMPVPQVKVGPDGSLVIDEQSLVIEHTGAKKSRQAMARTEALVDEDGNGSGFYKKRQKSKDWPKWETLKFYKALNTVGTDFSLIQTLFPQRTRQEIKLKFKKEEKINPRLVEKALTNHQEFDIDTLREDLATFEESIKRRSELRKTENQTTGRQRGRKRKNVKSRRMVAASISEINDSVGENDCCIDGSTCADDEEATATLTGKRNKNLSRRSIVNNTSNRLTSTSSSNESGSDTEIYQVKPTRSGRTPKIRKLQAPMIDDDEDDDNDDDDNNDNNMCSDDDEDGDDKNENSQISNNKQNNILLNTKDNRKTTICVQNSSWKSRSVHDSLSGISQVEPGSLVIVSRESADDPGETVLQVYMVSSDMDDGHGSRQNMTPVVLTPELLNTVTAGITKVTPIHVNPE